MEPVPKALVLGQHRGRPLEVSYWDNEHQGSGPALLLIHGLFDHKGTWQGLWPRLQDRFRLVAVDLVGFGHSSKPRLDDCPPSYRYSAAMHAENLREVIGRLGLQQVVLAGHSLGGGIALYLCCTWPELAGRLRGLVLIAPAAYPQPLPGYARQLADWRGAILQWPLVPRLVLGTGLAEWAVRRTLLRVFHDPAKIPAGSLEAAIGVLRTRDVFYAYQNAVRNIVPPDHEALVARFGQIGCPALVLWGRQDRIVPVEFAARLAAEIPAARLRIIEECGHAPHLEHPDLVAGVIADWYPTDAPEENAPCRTTPS